MGIISQRIAETIEAWTSLWKERFRGFWISIISLAFEGLLHAIGKAGAVVMKPLIDKMEATGKIPEELKPIFEEMRTPTGEWQGAVAMMAGGAVMGGAFGAIGDAMFLPMAYEMNDKTRNVILNVDLLILLYRRGYINEDYFRKHMHMQGMSDEWVDHFLEVTRWFPGVQDLIKWQAREVFEPEMIQRYGLDDEFDRLDLTLFRQAGISDEQSRFNWRAHWEHASWNQVVEMLRRGQLTEEQVRDWFRLVEIPPFWRDKLIAISWEVPTRVDVRRWWDMQTIDEARLREIYTAQGYHGKDLDDYVLWTKVYTAFPDLISRWQNGWITIEDVERELTALGMPGARVKELIETKLKATQAARTTKERDLTKTDIIKGVKQGRISRSEGVDLLMDLGYSEDEATYLLDINIPEDETDEAVKERQLTKADILKGLKAEVLTEDQARDKLLELRYSPTDVDLLLAIYRANVKPPEEPRQKEASKADIIEAVKKGLLLPEEAYLMLQDIDYSPEAAEFILGVRAESSPFSPASFEEFKKLTQEYRRASGMEGKTVPEELKKAGEELVLATKAVEDLQRQVKEEEDKLIPGVAIPTEATKRLKQLRVALRRAEAQKAEVQQRYDELRAEYKFTP